PFVSRPPVSWLPSKLHPEAFASRPPFVTRLVPPADTTETSSSRHSPSFSSENSSPVIGDTPSPNSMVPGLLKLAQALLPVSSLSPQLGARRMSLRKSISSKLLPPPSDHFPQRPPSAYVTSSSRIMFVPVNGFESVTLSPPLPSFLR